MKLERLRSLREQNDWTQKYVAHCLNISARSYSHYENGTRNMPLEYLVECVKLFGTTTDYVLYLSNDPGIKKRGDAVLPGKGA